MNWLDKESTIDISPPAPFNYEECLLFLGRSEQEVLYEIKDGAIWKLHRVAGNLVLFKISHHSNMLKVEFPISPPSQIVRKEIAEYIWEWFDLDTDLNEFYKMAVEDPILHKLTNEYEGLRMMCLPDLFEALSWAVMGQQINLTFAYTLKKRFVEQFGESLSHGEQTYWLYPSAARIATLEVEDLRPLQFTGRKAEYIIGIAKTLASGELTKEKLLNMPTPLDMYQALIHIRGVGAWTADYVLMKCLHHQAAFPIADVGLHNALKNQLGLERKPSIMEIKEIAAHWEGWQAYATFYLWRSLYDRTL
ncbi:DNA-3-methyladenine glycosylase family protein [Paenisporosarcina quisquiliarum]|uniref:DNA-3-methyladenine glycosylase family protein n=1 Tax=Paenisporosarcina quisquiliarum TaxID=365346 RepID=UPI003735A371